MTSQTKLYGNHGNAIRTERMLQEFCKLPEKLHALLIKYSMIRMIKSGNVRRAEYESWRVRPKVTDCLGEQDADGRHLKQGGKAWNVFMWPRMGDFGMVLVNQVLNLQTENLTQLTKNNI